MSTLAQRIPADYRAHCGAVIATAAFAALESRVAQARAQGRCFPPEEATFRALELTPFDRVKAIILGQDPYHDDGQAQGLAFSVAPGVKLPPSLRNIFREWSEDLGILFTPRDGDLSAWAQRGVLLLNTTLTVAAHQANSHRNFGWEQLTDRIIAALSEDERPKAFVLWGAPAQRKQSFIDPNRHLILCAPHPSPLSSYRGFFGSKPFSRINEFLIGRHLEPIDWSLSS